MPTGAWRAELKLVIGGILILLLIGLSVGHVLFVFFLGVCGYLGRQLFQVYRLERWLRIRPQPRLPDDHGIWGEIFGRLQWLQRLRRDRKRLISGLLVQFRRSSDAMPDAVVILTLGGRIEWQNKAAGRFLGLRRRQDVGRPITDFIRTPEFVSYMNKGDYESPIEITSPVLPKVHLLVQLVAYGHDRMMLLARDITPLHRLDQVRRDFVANVSHELRSPLTVIRGYVETMVDDAPKIAPVWQKSLGHIDEQSRRLTRIVDDLLMLSKIESNPSAAAPETVDVSQLISSILSDAQAIGARERKTLLEVDAELFLLGDAKQLYSAFSNLWFNALQYTADDDIIYVRWQVRDAVPVFEVEDTGDGIEAKHLARLTERFYRADEARSRQVGGTGLGLSIVKHILMRHEGHLTIDSKPGQGSRFTCWFPAERRFSSGASSQSSA